jgi:hypothetical protein
MHRTFLGLAAVAPAKVVVTTPSMPAEEAFTVDATGRRSVNRPGPVADAT